MSYSVGTLTVRPRATKITIDTDTFGVGDPYLVLKIGTHEYKTAAHKNTSAPTFTETFSIKIDQIYNFHVKVMDEDVGRDDFVAETTVSLQDVIVKGKAIEVVTLSRDGKDVGNITFELDFLRQN